MAARSAYACLSAMLVSLFASAASAQSQPTLPDGWERPTNDDLAGPNLGFRKDKPGRFLVAEGDFDGDGVADRAEILVSHISRTYAVYAFTSKSPAPIQPVDGRIQALEHMGIDTVEPGLTKTACGKGYDEADPNCKRGVPKVDIPYPSIEYFGFESGASQFYWTGEKFERVRTSN